MAREAAEIARAMERVHLLRFVGPTSAEDQDAPGLGVDFDEAEVRHCSFQPGSHPLVRLEDGTM